MNSIKSPIVLFTYNRPWHTKQTVFVFNIQPLEYFDKEGYFHTTNYDFSNGYIFRCSKNYKGRFTNSVEEYVKMISSVPPHLRQQIFDYGISYTSLIVDLINE